MKNKALKFEPQRGVMPVLQICMPDQLGVDPSYQRSTDNIASRSLIERIARCWDWNLCHPLVVSRRHDGGLFVIDGQHRLSAAKLRGDIMMLPCIMISCSDAAAEATNFSKMNQQRKPLTGLEIFRAELAAADPVATHIFKVLEQSGLGLAHSTNNQDGPRGHLANVGGLKTCLAHHGDEVFSASVALLAGAFGDQVLQYAGTIYPGIAEVARHEVQRWKGRQAPGAWRTSERFGAAVDFLKSRPQGIWYQLVHDQKSREPSSNLRTCAATLFLARWDAFAR